VFDPAWLNKALRQLGLGTATGSAVLVKDNAAGTGGALIERK